MVQNHNPCDAEGSSTAICETFRCTECINCDVLLYETPCDVCKFDGLSAISVTESLIDKYSCVLEQAGIRPDLGSFKQTFSENDAVLGMLNCRCTKSVHIFQHNQKMIHIKFIYKHSNKIVIRKRVSE